MSSVEGKVQTQVINLNPAGTTIRVVAEDACVLFNPNPMTIKVNSVSQTIVVNPSQ